MMALRIHVYNDGIQPLPAQIAILIDSAGSARRASADYRQMSRDVPRLGNKFLSDAARKIDDARWYLRLAHDRNAERAQS